jgi:cleavage and polyadenylation specificity factor subunit 1
MLCLADFHLGSEVTATALHSILMAPIPDKVINHMRIIPLPGGKEKASTCTIQLLSYGKKMIKSSSPKTSLLVGSADGGVCILLPVEERVFKRLNLLQHMLSMTLESVCALNPKDFRAFKSAKFRLEKKKGLLDGSLLWMFASLDAATQDFLASSMGTSAEMILENLHDLDLSINFF